MPGVQARAVVSLQEDALRCRETLCDERAARFGQGLRMKNQAVLQEIQRDQEPERRGGEEFKK
jgi:hypothetical protein